MLAAAAPTTSKQVSAMIVKALVKRFSGSVERHIAENWALIKA
jgi:hypothetical protein